jgi:hypothetical protein
MNPYAGSRGGGLSPRRPPYTSRQAATGGIPHGTPVLTLDGELPIEFLSEGDRVITRNAGSARLLSRHSFRCRRAAVLIQAGSLGQMRPETDTVLPACQHVLVRDWRARALFGQPQAMVAAGVLADGEYIRDLGEMELQLHVLCFERDQVVYAGGLELLSQPERIALRPAA